MDSIIKSTNGYTVASRNFPLRDTSDTTMLLMILIRKVSPLGLSKLCKGQG